MTFDPKDYELVILVKDIQFAPEVYVSGEILKKKIEVGYQYMTSTESEGSGAHSYELKYVEDKESIRPSIKGLSHKNLEAAFAEDIE